MPQKLRLLDKLRNLLDQHHQNHAECFNSLLPWSDFLRKAEPTAFNAGVSASPSVAFELPNLRILREEVADTRENLCFESTSRRKFAADPGQAEALPVRDMLLGPTKPL